MQAPRYILLVSSLLLMAAAGCGEEEPPADGIRATGGTRGALTRGAFLPLSTTSSTLLDAAGRQVILRGVQHHSLQDVDYYGREVKPEEYPLIASWGFTTLRVATSWSKVEPNKGQYSAAYLQQIKGVMDLAHKAGLTVILEWHQDLWGRCAVDPTSSFAVNANGAPDWTCPAGFKPTSTLDSWTMFDNLWTNKDGLQDAFVAAWLRVLEEVGSHPALLGLDVFNEPQGTGGSPALERDKLFPAWRRIVPALRKGGAKGLLFLDATIMRNETLQMHTEPLDAVGSGLVYAPHLYSGWLLMYVLNRPVPAAEKRRDFEAALKQAAALKLPMWNGEWGVNLNLSTAQQDLWTHVTMEDEYLVGSSYWAFQKAVPGQGDASISGAQAIKDKEDKVRQEVVDRLSRPYPIQTPGQLQKLAYSKGPEGPRGGTLTVKLKIGKATTAPLVIYAPRRHLTNTICLDVKGTGGWVWDHHADKELLLVRFDTAGDFTVTMKPCG